MAGFQTTILGRAIWRERRRAGVGAALMFGAGLLAFAPVGGAVAGLPLPLVGGLAFVGALLPPLVILGLLIPAWRFVTEVAAAGLLVLCAIGLAVPQLGLAALAAGSALPVIAAVVVLLALAYLYGGAALDGWRRHTHAVRATVTSRLDHLPLWDGIVGTPPLQDRLADTEVVVFDHLDSQSADRVLVSRSPDGAMYEEHHFVDEIAAPNHIRYRWQAADADPGFPMSEGARDVLITAKGDLHRIDIVEAVREMPWRLVVTSWIDDSFGRRYDGFVAALERRAVATADLTAETAELAPPEQAVAAE